MRKTVSAYPILLALSVVSMPSLADAEDCADETCFLIQRTDRKEILSAFVKAFPGGAHIDVAKHRLDVLNGSGPGAGGHFPEPRKVRTLRIKPDGSVF